MKRTDGLIGVYPTLSPRAAFARRAPARFPFDQDGLTLTHLGRGAIWLGLRAAGLGPGARIAMPSYHCGAEVEAARLAGAEIDFYRVDESLRVDEDDLARAASSADATCLISHFGFPLGPPPSGRLIEDVSHALFSEDQDGPLGARAEIAVFSLRKSLGVPDGAALLLRDGATSSAQAEPGRPPARHMLRSTGALLAGRGALSRHRPVRSGASGLIGRTSRADAAAAAGTLTDAVIGEWDLTVEQMAAGATSPSRITERVAPRVSGEAVRARRRANYELLAAELADHCPEPYRELPSGVCPLYLPVFARNRPGAIVRLLERGVRAIEIWPVPHPLLDRDAFPEPERARRELLALPVHQDLEQHHMEAVLGAAKEALSLRG